MSAGLDNFGYQKENGEVVIPVEKSWVAGEERLTYSWEKVNVFALHLKGFGKKKVTQEKHILKDVAGICRPGELLAIMGASGAGQDHSPQPSSPSERPGPQGHR
ncbi:protein white-like [Procambarus clarkii]|uniref:protein white-like n=1 Tax=Procambarus clarkii TaxID=6728 RepID=UPI003742A0D2